MTDRIRKLHIPGIIRNCGYICDIFTNSSISVKYIFVIKPP